MHIVLYIKMLCMCWCVSIPQVVSLCFIRFVKANQLSMLYLAIATFGLIIISFPRPPFFSFIHFFFLGEQSLLHPFQRLWYKITWPFSCYQTTVCCQLRSVYIVGLLLQIVQQMRVNTRTAKVSVYILQLFLEEFGTNCIFIMILLLKVVW